MTINMYDYYTHIEKITINSLLDRKYSVLELKFSEKV